MRVYKCDKCEEIIPDKDKHAAVNAGFGFGSLWNHQFCKKCSEPIARILKAFKLKKYD